MSEALRLMRELGASDDNADLLCRRGDSKLRYGDPAGARADYELAIEIARRSGMPESRALSEHALSECLQPPRRPEDPRRSRRGRSTFADPRGVDDDSRLLIADVGVKPDVPQIASRRLNLTAVR